MTDGAGRHSTTAASTDGTVRGRRRPRRLWLIVAVQALLMLSVTVLYPAFQNPDEVSHVDYVLAHRQGQFFDAPGTRSYQSGSLIAKQQVPDTQFREHVGTVDPPARSSRLSIDELGTAPSNSPFKNQMTQHPPLYYTLAAGFSYLLPHFSHHRYDVQVFWLRLFSVLLLLPVPLLIFGAARRATGSQSVALVASVIPLALPSYLRTGASVTNDSLLVLLGTIAAALLVRAAFGDLTRRTAVLLGVAWGAALLTKGFALSLPPAIVLAYLVGADGTFRQRVRSGIGPMLVAGIVGSVIGAWWWVRNLIDYHAVQPDGLGPLSDALRQQVFGTDRPGGGEPDFFGNFFRLLSQRVFGSLGLIDTPTLAHPLLQTMSIVALVALIASVLLGLKAFRRRGDSPLLVNWRADRALTLLLPAVLTILVMYVGARGRYLNGRQLAGIQVRYLLPGILGLVICLAVLFCWLSGRFTRWVAPVVLTLTLAFMALSVLQVLTVEMSGYPSGRVQELRAGLHFVVNWAPFPGAVTAALLALTALIALLTLVAFWAGASREVPVERDSVGAGRPVPAGPA